MADEDDAREAIKRLGIGRGQVWSLREIELVGRFVDPATRDEIALFKRTLDGWLSPDLGTGGVL